MVQLMPWPLSCFIKIHTGYLPFWCWLTYVVMEKDVKCVAVFLTFESIIALLPF